MKNSLFLKMLTIAGLLLVLVVPLMMIQGKVSDRENEAWQVRTSLSEQVGGEQILSGPVIVVKRTTKKLQEKSNCKKDEKCTYWKHSTTHFRYIPEILAVNGKMKTEMRFRGIYGSPMYRSLLQIEAQMPVFREPVQKPEVLVSEEAMIITHVSALRGLVELPSFMVNGKLLALIETDELPSGLGENVVAARLPGDLRGPFSVQIRLNLNGAESLSFVPLAKQTEVNLQSDWPHPSFEGLALPVDREISGAGFNSRWRTNSLASSSAIHCARNQGLCLDRDESLRVRLVQPVTGLLSSERALKYSFLIVGLTFAAFFLFEVLRRYPLHAMQYLLVGLALAMFYLLLVALSEHIDFVWAYLAAALSCCALIGVYLMAVMRSPGSGWGFAGSLLLVQGLIYGILMAEDYALLLGALLLFVALSAVMLVTRKLDWYSFAAAGRGNPKAMPVTGSAS